ncbi:hypothetical protein JT188_08645, partial [Helicobacter pylori]|nr:hypothetical protein [Helicobacter pylori]
ENFKKLNEAYQIIQTAFKGNPKEGLPVLSNTNTTMEVKIITKNNSQAQNTQAQDTNETKNVTNNAHNLLTQAQTIMNVLTQNCPWVNNREGELGGASWNIKKGGNVCQIFDTEISAIQDVIKNATIVVEQSKIVAANVQNQHNLDTGKTFNPYKDANFAQSMFANAKAQAEILNRAQAMV